jgi:surface antigen
VARLWTGMVVIRKREEKVMDIYTATEQAYKNGYANAVKKFATKVKEKNGNGFIESWYESGDECYEFNQEKFEEFIDSIVNKMCLEVE